MLSFLHQSLANLAIDSLLSAVRAESPTDPRVPAIGDDAATLFTKDSPSYSFIIGGGGTTRAAVFALSSLGVSPIYLINRDADETKSIIDHFPNLSLIALQSVEEAEKALKAETDAGKRLAIGVGCIPSIEPQTEAEKTVYAISKKIFEVADSGSSDSVPKSRFFLEMCYKVCHSSLVIR